MEQLPLLSVQQEHLNVGTNETDPVPLCDQVTLPVGKYPVTLAVQMMVVEEPTRMELGLQDTVLLVAYIVTARLCVPPNGEFLESPP
jgi:hypothetical protein